MTAAGNGTATITATVGGVSGTAAVTVRQEVNTVTVSPAADSLVEGDTLRLTTEATDANGHAVAGTEFVWASGDTAVAVVDATGLVTGVGAGEVEITATSSGVTGSAALVVEVPAPTTVAIAPDTVEMAALGDTVRLMAEVRDQIGRPVEGEAVAWASGDTLVATVDSTGLVTAAGNGTATVTATAGTVQGSVVVIVMQSAGSVTVSPPVDTIAPGDTLRLAAEALDENGRVVEGAEFAWSSSDATVARVDGSGLVHGVAEGVATITATAGDARGTAKITIENPDRAVLVALYRANNGANWLRNDNWLTDAPLGDWYGVDVDGRGRVVTLDVGGIRDPETGWKRNDLTGPIPPALRHLTNLRVLGLSNNDLWGPIPPELGSLTNLQSVYIGRNDFAGALPPELGNLFKLQQLSYWDSPRLVGPLPETLTGLDSLVFLSIDRTGLCVPQTTEFQLWWRDIDRVEGENCPIVQESDREALAAIYRWTNGDGWGSNANWLGDGPLDDWYGVTADSTDRVTALDLSDNNLEGFVPAEAGDLLYIESLVLNGNSGLGGELSPRMLQLAFLSTLRLDGTGVCTSAAPIFLDWLERIADARVAA